MSDLDTLIRFRGRRLGCKPSEDDVYYDLELRLGDMQALNSLFGIITVVMKDGVVYVPEKSYSNTLEFCDDVGMEYDVSPF